VPTSTGLPGWFPDDFKTDPDLLDAFEDSASWHGAGKRGTQQHSREHGMSIDLAGRAGSYRPPPSAGKWKPTGEMSRKTAGSMRKLAVNLKDRHPDIGAHAHVADAARALDRGDHDAAVRHLNAAVANMTPQSLYRHGIVSDAEHMQAKGSMDEIHRHLLLVRDVQDAKANNDALTAAPAQDGAPGAEDPGSMKPNAPKPAARPGQAQAVNAPARQNDGKPPVTADQPKPTTTTKWQVTKQVAASNSGDLTTTIELGFLHHFDPSELRGKGGKWISSGELAGHAERDIPKMAAREGDDPVGFGKMRSRKQALDAARGGRPHEAARILRVSSRTGDRSGYGDYDDKAMQYAEAFRRLPDDSPEESERENKFLTEHIAHPRLMEEEAAGQASALDRTAGRIRFRGPAAGHVRQAAASLRAMDFDAAVSHLNDASASVVGHGDNADAAGKMIDAAIARAQKAADYSWNMKTSGLYQSSIAASNLELSAKTGALATVSTPVSGKPGGPGLWHQKGMGLPPYIRNIAKAIMRKRGMDESHAIAIAKGATSRWAKGGGKVSPEVRAASTATNADWDAKRARAHAHANAQDVARAIELAAHAPYRYRHGWIKIGGGASMPVSDRAAVQAHRAEDTGVALGTMRAQPGSQGHAEELRQLAREADLHTSRNYASLMGSQEGTASDRQTSIGGGSDRGAIPSSDASAALKRAATMIARGQPSIARLHSGTIRDAAKAEAKGEPAYAARLSAAADKLDALPARQGLAAPVRPTPAFRANTAAARKYSTASLSAHSNHGVLRVIELNWAPWDAGRRGGSAAQKAHDTASATAKAHLAAHGITPGTKAAAQHLAQHITGNQGHSHPFMARMGTAIKKGLSDPNPGSDRENGPAIPGSGNWAYQRNMSNAALARRIIELTGTAAGAAMDTHGITGQFAPAGSATGAAAKTGAKNSKAKTRPKPSAHQQHVAHVAHAGANAQKKTALLATAKGDRAKAVALEAKRKLLQSQLASASGKITKGQKGATSAKQAGATTKTTAPAAKAAAAPAKTAAKTTAKAVSAKLTSAQIKTQIAGLNTQINGLLKQAAAATAQAAKL
jgi:hypothetical protein